MGPCLWKKAGLDGLNLLNLWLDDPLSNDVAEVLYFSFGEGTLGSVDSESRRVETLKHHFEVL